MFQWLQRLMVRIVGSAKAEGDVSEEQHLQDLQVALQRLPKVHLYVLDAIVSHLRKYVYYYSFMINH
jgi:hypothetical protein